MLDRGEAIEHAVRGARAGDVVMILGRGSGSGPLVDRDGELRPFDDRAAARRALAAAYAGSSGAADPRYRAVG